ncbi:MAG: tol-pal system protein YbgF [candidate division Zixibacteria bacterium RBG-1]|nr:MAG: tol-pal system protein YbgF [candidate division Zixibacteria bacterium RBG-1]OGC86381.1 MAG: hypothetical protein A2V73_02680 [candidate division Zixibacteria bacterium RBG_19FT_COMBO_42_43]
MDKETYSDDRVVVLSKDFIFVKVNTKEDTLTKKQYQVFATPTALMANADGQEIDRVVGFHPTEQFLPIIKDYQKGKNTLGDLEKKAGKNPKDVKLLYTLGDKYQWRGGNEKAVEMFNKVVELDPENKSGKADSSAFNLAYLKYRQKDYQSAIADFEMFKTEYTNPNLVGDAQIYIAASYEKSDNKAEALKQYQKYLEMYPEGENADYAKEQIEKLTQKAEKAE